MELVKYSKSLTYHINRAKFRQKVKFDAGTQTFINEQERKLADVKAKAKAIAVATPDPAGCANQLREVVAEISEQCFNTADKKLDEFDPTALTLFSEALDSFVYTEEADEPAEDDLDI